MYYNYLYVYCISLLQVHEVINNIHRDTHVNHPVHHVEGEEGDGEDYPTVLVNVAGLQVIQAFHNIIF